MKIVNLITLLMFATPLSAGDFKYETELGAGVKSVKNNRIDLPFETTGNAVRLSGRIFFSQTVKMGLTVTGTEYANTESSIIKDLSGVELNFSLGFHSPALVIANTAFHVYSELAQPVGTWVSGTVETKPHGFSLESSEAANVDFRKSGLRYSGGFQITARPDFSIFVEGAFSDETWKSRRINDQGQTVSGHDVKFGSVASYEILAGAAVSKF